jgi:hypothetical protein
MAPVGFVLLKNPRIYCLKSRQPTLGQTPYKLFVDSYCQFCYYYFSGGYDSGYVFWSHEPYYLGRLIWRANCETDHNLQFFFKA